MNEAQYKHLERDIPLLSRDLVGKPKPVQDAVVELAKTYGLFARQVDTLPLAKAQEMVQVMDQSAALIAAMTGTSWTLPKHPDPVDAAKEKAKAKMKLKAKALKLSFDSEALSGLYDDYRASGAMTKDGHTYTRQKSVGKSIKGKKDMCYFGLTEAVQIQYVIISASKLQPSHLGASQNPLHFIPEAQPRNRAQSQSGSTVPQLMADNLRPGEISQGTNAYSGAPIVNDRGEVIQGSGRAYALKLYWKNYPTDPKGYAKYISSNCDCFGFEACNVAQDLSDPVLVRMASVRDSEAIRLGQFTQSDSEAVSSSTAKIKSKTNRVSEEGIEKIIRQLTRMDDGEMTLAQLIQASSAIDILIEEKVVRGDERELYTSGRRVNPEGTVLVQTFLLNTVFKGGDINLPELFKTLPHAFQRGFEKGLLSILRTPKQKRITSDIQQSIMAYREWSSFKEKTQAQSIKAWYQTADLFDGGKTPLERYSPVAIALVERFDRATTQREVQDIFDQYRKLVTDQPPDLMNPTGTAGMSRQNALKKLLNINPQVDTEPKTKAKAKLRLKAKALKLSFA